MRKIKIYMLDTDTCSYVIKQNPALVVSAFWEHRDDEICISSVTYAELMYGAVRTGFSKTQAAIRRFVTLVDIMNFDGDSAEEYARLRHFFANKGTPVTIADLMTASCAKSNKAVLVTSDIKHFGKVPELEVENWIKPE